MTFSGRQHLLEDDLLWKTTFVGRRPIVEDYLRWKTTFSGRLPSVDLCMLPTLLCGILSWRSEKGLPSFKLKIRKSFFFEFELWEVQVFKLCVLLFCLYWIPGGWVLWYNAHPIYCCKVLDTLNQGRVYMTLIKCCSIYKAQFKR